MSTLICDKKMVFNYFSLVFDTFKCVSAKFSENKRSVIPLSEALSSFKFGKNAISKMEIGFLLMSIFYSSDFLRHTKFVNKEPAKYSYFNEGN